MFKVVHQRFPKHSLEAVGSAFFLRFINPAISKSDKRLLFNLHVRNWRKRLLLQQIGVELFELKYGDTIKMF